MLTVIIPTAHRAGMLRTALQSVADQTACARIGRIIVSENGGDRASAQVCAQFPHLPITYLFRQPSLTPLEHGRLLMRDGTNGDLTAILHDDDWWAPTHLQCALAALEANPGASAYGAANFVVSAESSMLNCSGNLFPWFGANYPAFSPWWTLPRLSVLLAELLGTVSHYSTLVARTAALREASFVYDTGNTFDNDRMLMFALSASGPLLFNPTPQAFVRNHGVQDCVAYDGHAKVRHMSETTRWLVDQSGRSWDAVLASFNRRLALCPNHAAATLQLLATKAWCLPEMKKHAGDLVAA
jgi:hypothetical protein